MDSAQSENLSKKNPLFCISKAKMLTTFQTLYFLVSYEKYIITKIGSLLPTTFNRLTENVQLSL